MAALEELERHMRKLRETAGLTAGWMNCYAPMPGVPRLYFSPAADATTGRGEVYLKREDLLHTGAHKINNCLGQALLVERMGSIGYRGNRRRTAWSGHGDGLRAPGF